MDRDQTSDAQAICTSGNGQVTNYTPLPYTSPIPLPMPREFNGKKYYGAVDVAKIIGVTQKTVWKWQNELYFGCALFPADERAHDGRYLYEVERVLQLKSVYHKDWMRGGYQPSPTTTAAEPLEKRDTQNSFPDLINTKEAASILGVSTSALKHWRERKLFGVPFFPADEMHGGTCYYYRERVEQLKSVYNKGILQNMYKIAYSYSNFDPSVFETPKAPEVDISVDFQKSVPTDGTYTSPRVIPSQKPVSGEFYPLETVAMMLRVDEKTLHNWRDKKIFVEDYKTHVGIFFYSEDRVLEMKLFCQKNQAEQESSTLFEEVLQSGESPSKVLKRLNIQIHPSKVRTELNDKQTRTIFKLSEENTEELLNNNTFKIVEKRNYKRYGDITTSYKILNAAGYDIKRPIDQFDRAVLSVCISEWLAGNRCTTIPIIYRALTGKVNKGADAKPTKEQRAAILNSIQILMSRTFISDPSAARSLLKYNDGSTTTIHSALLPVWYAENTTINGQDADTVIFFDRPCPLLAMAKAKRQILTYDTQLLDIPKQQNTTMNIKLKNYCMIRVQEIIAHRKQMRPIVTFKDVFEKCRLEQADRKTKLRAREFMLTFFEHLKHETVIKDFKLTKRGNVFHSIEISRSKSKK